MALVTLLLGGTFLLLNGASMAGADIAPPRSDDPTSTTSSTTTTSGSSSAGGSTSSTSSTGSTATKAVDVLKVDGLIDPITVSFLYDAFAQAERSGSIAVVLTLDSEGAVVPDAELVELVRAMQESPVPVDVWVGPSNSSATGRAAWLLAGARTIGVAPGARIGGDGAGDARAVLGNAGLLNDNSRLITSGALAEGNRVLGATDAKDLGVTQADAPTVLEFLVNLPGFETQEKVVDGRTTREPVTQVRFTQLDLIHQLFHAVASPSSAYLLITIGLALLVFELFTAGVGVAGVVGATCFVFGCYGLAAMPTRPVALALVVLAFVALAVDVQTGVPRVWTGIGLGAYLVGSLLLFDGVSMSWITLVAGLGGMALAFLSGMPSMVRTRFSTPTIGREWMVGEMGRAVTAISPDGVVQIQGAMWRAFTNRATPIDELDKIRVVGIEGLVLEVEPEEGGARDYRERGPKDADPAGDATNGSDPSDD